MSNDNRRGWRPVVLNCFVALVLLFGSLLHYGYYFSAEDRVSTDAVAGGTVVDCWRQWQYLGILSVCDVQAPGSDSPALDEDERVADTVLRVKRSRIDGAGPGDSVPLAYESGGMGRNEDGDMHQMPGRWEVARSSSFYGLAPPVQVAIFGLGIWFIVRTVRAYRKRFEARPDKRTTSVPSDGFDRATFVIMSVLAAGFGIGAPICCMRWSYPAVPTDSSWVSFPGWVSSFSV